MWALVRQDAAHSAAFWTVILACGHVETGHQFRLDLRPATAFRDRAAGGRDGCRAGADARR
jgi:hypothetical protein